MKLTEKLKLKLFEKTDRVSYKPINENAEAIEAELGKQAENLTAEIAAVMAAMGSGGKTARIDYGSYIGNGAASKTLAFDFVPVFVVVVGDNGKFCTTMIRGAAGSQYNNQTVSVGWGEKSVTVSGPASSTHLTVSGNRYCYVAIGV